MKKVIVISTSLRPGSNSDMLADKFAEGAKAAGNDVEKISLVGKNIQFCKGCLACQKLGRCVINDDVNDIMARVLKAGVIAAETSVIETGEKYHALLSRRFDRTAEGRRKHFASALTLLGLTDGCDAKTGNSYLDIVDFILQNCCDVEQNLRQLYRRVAFNIAIGNSDDHFRNHGFLLTPRGWTLSPAYDMNPTLNEYQALLVNSTTNHADLQVLLDSSEEYMIGKEEAVRIIEEVKTGVKHWKSIATRLGIAKREMDVFEQVFQRSLK